MTGRSGDDSLSLPVRRDHGGLTLSEALLRRRSHRTYGAGPLTLEEVGDLLWAGQGITGTSGMRTAPSAGATFPLEILLAVGRFDPQQLVESGNGYGHGDADHGHAFSTWSFQTDQPMSLEALNEMVKKRLPGNIYRCKGVVYAAENPERRAVLQVVGRRADVALDEEWGETKPRTQIVAIGATGSIDPELLTAQFDACLS